LSFILPEHRRRLRPTTSRCGAMVTVDGREYIDFSSNDYLGFSHRQDIWQDWETSISSNLGFGSGGSRLLGGDYDLFHQLESELASFFAAEAALVFNSGYQCNLGILSTLVQPGDVVFMDKLCHASIVDGVKLSGVTFYRFRHNDSTHLEQLLKNYRSKYAHALIVTESIFSMDGDISPLRELISLKKRYGCALMVDEAHAIGIYGPKGAGVLSAQGIGQDVDIIVGTFGKTLGSSGAFAIVSQALKDNLIQKCRSFIYSTSLPLPVIAFNLVALRYLQRCQYGVVLLEKASAFRTRLLSLGCTVLGQSHIVPVVIGQEGPALEWSDRFKAHGIWVTAIRPPTVPPNQSRLRFSINIHHDEVMIDRVISVLGGCHEVSMDH